MAVDTETLLEVDRGTWTPMLHLEHPDRIGEAWCGAEVLGVREVAPVRDIDCVVCADLRAARRDGRY